MLPLLTRLLPWLRVCRPGEHLTYLHLDETNTWWRKCRRCPWVAEDRRILMRGDVPVIRPGAVRRDAVFERRRVRRTA